MCPVDIVKNKSKKVFPSCSTLEKAFVNVKDKLINQDLHMLIFYQNHKSLRKICLTIVKHLFKYLITTSRLPKPTAQSRLMAGFFYGLLFFLHLIKKL